MTGFLSSLFSNTDLPKTGSFGYSEEEEEEVADYESRKSRP